MLGGRFNEILEPAIKEYMDEVKAEIGDSIMSFMFEKDGKAYFYNLQVVEISQDPAIDLADGATTGFPIWVCMGGSKVPKDGCRRTHREGVTVDGEEKSPLKCSYCGNREFRKIEDIEEMREWVENYQPRGESQ